MKRLPTLCVCVVNSYHSFITTVFSISQAFQLSIELFFEKKTYKTLYCLQDAQCTSTHCAVFGMQSFSVSERSESDLGKLSFDWFTTLIHIFVKLYIEKGTFYNLESVTHQFKYIIRSLVQLLTDTIHKF